jgi:hypothetical protein
MKKVTNESLTKNSANLDEIIGNVDQMDALINSREFVTSLINDLINNKRNVVEWKLVDGNGSLDSIDPHTIKDTFGIDYSFDFKYKYQDQVVPLTIFISGEVPFKVSPRVRGDYFTQPEGGEATVDYKYLANNLDLGLFDQDGTDIDISWLTPELKKRVTTEIIKDYV